ncbi:MAG: YkgJ family cysteine cluster protein [Bryobacterales bacterium]|nr:YkgJ family cysteine cluster protein [Bryobacterales bacterium]
MNQQLMNQLWVWDAQELRILGQGLAQAHARAGEHAHCHRGCFSCCLGPFPITALDALRLQRGLDALHLADPPRALRLSARAAEAWAALLPHFPGNPATATLDESAAEQTLYSPTLQMLPCPALDLESGACELYHHRPVACRTFGFAVTLDGTRLDPCSLNYAGLSREQWEPLRLTLDPPSPPPAPLPPGLTVVAAALALFTPASPACPPVGPPATAPTAPPAPPASPA